MTSLTSGQAQQAQNETAPGGAAMIIVSCILSTELEQEGFHRTHQR